MAAGLAHTLAHIVLLCLGVRYRRVVADRRHELRDLGAEPLLELRPLRFGVLEHVVEHAAATTWSGYPERSRMEPASIGMEDERSLVRAAPLARVALAGELDRSPCHREVVAEAEAGPGGFLGARASKCYAVRRKSVTGA